MPSPILSVLEVLAVSLPVPEILWNANADSCGTTESDRKLGDSLSAAVLKDSALDDVCLDVGGGDRLVRFRRRKGGDGLLLRSRVFLGGVRSGVGGLRWDWLTGVTEPDISCDG